MTRCLTLLLLVAATGTAGANGRPEQTQTINFRHGHESDIFAGMTFGALVSHDDGATWHWFCEKAILYGGMYDPDYVYDETGAVFATTFDGSLVNRNGCVFEATAFGKKSFSSITEGPDGALYMAAVEVPDGPGNAGDAKIYKSIDHGMTFDAGTAAGKINDWYSSIEVAPTDASRVYLAGYRFVADGTRALQIYRSSDGGASFTQPGSRQPSGRVGHTMDTTLEIVGIKRGAPDTVFVRATQVDGNVGEAIWRTDDAGESWTRILERPEPIAFVVRANGDLVAGTQLSGTVVSRGPSNTTWEPVAGAPHINCLVENAAGELWACTQNYGRAASTMPPMPMIPSDGAGIMKTTDLARWTPVLRYQDIAGPVDCAPGTRQHDQCVYDCPDMTYNDNPALCPNLEPKSWCALKKQLDITSTVLACPGDEVAPPKGCCETSDSDGRAAIVFGGLGLLALTRRRSTRSRASSSRR